MGAIVFLSLLPGWLYLQFIAVKGKALWEEYILNLFRLHVDDYAHLPEPPAGSLFHRLWEKSTNGKVPEPRNNLYRKKFEGFYGQALGTDSNGEVLRFQGENPFPVLVATALLSVTWALVLQPEIVMRLHLVPGEFTISGRPVLPAETLRFGFVGTYFFILQMLVRRYYQDDLKTSAYISATVRIVIVALLVTTLHVSWPTSWSQQSEYAFAFVIGIFPQVGMQAIQALLALPLRRLVKTLDKKYPLSELDGMNIWYESRLLEEGIEDMQNLATANLVDAILRTRIPVDRLVDWVDQSHLYLRVRDDDGSKDAGPKGLSSRAKLRRLGIRTEVSELRVNFGIELCSPVS